MPTFLWQTNAAPLLGEGQWAIHCLDQLSLIKSKSLSTLQDQEPFQNVTVVDSSFLALVILCHIPPPPKFILSCSQPLWGECFLWTTSLAPLPSGFQLGLSLGGTGRRSRGGRRKKLGVFLPLPPLCIVQQFCGGTADHFCGSPPSVHDPSCRHPSVGTPSCDTTPSCGSPPPAGTPSCGTIPSCRHPSCGGPSHAGAPLL